MAVELATGYVNLVPSAQNIGANIAKELGGNGAVDAAAATAGTKASGEFGSKFSAGAKTAALAGTAVVAAAAVGIFQVGASFDEAYDKIRTGTGATGDQLNSLKDSFRAVVQDVPASFGDASTAISDINQRLGLTGDQLNTSSEQFLELSRITGTDLATNIDTATGAMNQWGVVGAAQPALLDELFRASQASGVAVSDLASGLTSAGPQFRALGIDVDQATGLLATLGKAGLDVGDVMPAMSKAMAKAAADGKDASTVFSDTFAAIQNAPDDTKAAGVALDVFGAKAGPKLAQLIREGSLSYEDLMGQIAGGSDTILGAGKDTADWGEKLEVLKNKALVGLEPLATGVFNGVGAAIDFLAPKIQGLTKWFSENKPVALALAAVFGTALVAGLIAYSVAAISASVASGALLFPFIAITIAVAALVAGVVWAWNNLSWFRDGVTAIWQAIVAIVTWAWQTVLQPIWQAIVAFIVNILVPYYQTLWDIAQVVWQGIVAVVTWAWTTVIQPIWQAISDFITNILVPYYQMLWDIAQAVWSGISTAISWAWENVIQPTWQAIQGFIDGVLIPVFNAVADVVSTVWSGISSAISTAWGIMQPVFGFIGDAIDTMKSAFSTVGDAAKAGFEALTGIVQGAFDGIRNLWNSTIGGFNIHIPGVPFTPFHGFDLTIPTLHTGGIVPGAPGADVLTLLQAGEFVVPAADVRAAITGRGGGSLTPGPVIGELHLHEVYDPYTAADEVAWRIRTGGA